MNYRRFSAWAVLIALAGSLALSPDAGARSCFSEDRNADGQADVCQFDDEDGNLVKVLRDRNFDGYVDARETRVTSNVVPQPFLLPRAIYVGDQPIVDRAPVTLEASSEFRSAASPSGRAPPAAR